MKKTALILLSAMLLIVGAFASGCGNPSGNGNFDFEDLDPDTKVTISFMHMWPEHEATINTLISSFTKKHPNITVNVSNVPYNHMEDVLQAAYINNALPNVYVFFTHYMTPLVSSSDGVMAGALNKLYDEIAGDFIQPDSWEMGKINGNYYSVPFRATAEMVFYNKTVFAQKGWTKPETFEQFNALLSAIKTDGAYTPLAAAGKEDQIIYLINAMSLFTAVLDGSVDEAGYKLGRLEPNVSDDTGVKIYEKVKGWVDADYFGKGAIALSKTGAIREFTSGNAAMVFANVNNVGEITSITDDEIGAFAIPAPQAIADEVKYVYGGYDGLSFNPGASENQKKASIMLIRHLVGKESQQILADRAQSIVVHKETVYNNPTYAAFAEEAKYVGAYSTGTDYITGTHSAGNASIVTTYLSGTAGVSAARIIELINENVLADMQDPLINNPVVGWYPRANPAKEYDKSWLN